jgi:hypothetical protein
MAMKVRKTTINGKKAVLISFNVDSEKFDSLYERNKFFRGLWGWKQVVKKGEDRYSYHREGILNEIPHMKVDNSVFIIALKHMEEMMRFFEGWSDKVMWKAFPIQLDDDFVEGGKDVKARKIKVE